MVHDAVKIVHKRSKYKKKTIFPQVFNFLNMTHMVHWYHMLISNKTVTYFTRGVKKVPRKYK